MIADWESFVEAYSEEHSEELDLASVLPGDRLRVVTTHTNYVFQMIDHQEALLTCSRDDRPHGRVRISGCSFRWSSTFKPRFLFCGGSLEFTYLLENQRRRFRTTAIQAIEIARSTADFSP
jgi:hypothetical protein